MYYKTVTSKKDTIRELESIVNLVANQCLSWKMVTQEDRYYDTENRALLNCKSSLRIRSSNGTKKCTFKSNKALQGIDGRFERIEDEVAVCTDDISDAIKFLSKNTRDAVESMTSGTRLEKALTILNRRKKTKIQLGSCEIEFAMDDVTYDGKTDELQVEIELVSKGHAEELEEFEEFIRRFAKSSENNRVFSISSMVESKYERGVSV